MAALDQPIPGTPSPAQPPIVETTLEGASLPRTSPDPGDVQPSTAGRDKQALLAMFCHYLALACALVFWATSLKHVALSHMNDLGLVSVLPVSYYVSLAMVTVSFCYLLRRRRPHTTALLLHAGLLIFIVHATPTLLYGTLRYAWAWKHVGIVDYIQRHGTVNPHISYLNAYHNWPGFFSLSAVFTNAAGFKSPLSYAAWGPVFFNFMFLGAMVFLLTPSGPEWRLRWLAIWFFLIANWVGQDYFSPQAFNFFLYLLLMALCLRRLGPAPAEMARATRLPDQPGAGPVRPRLTRWRRFLRSSQTGVGNEFRDPWPTDLPRWAVLATAVVLLMVIASSHQLTPFMTITALTALVVFRRCNARGLPLLMVVLTVGWLTYMAEPFLADNIRDVIRSIGALENNAKASVANLALASPQQAFVARVSRALTALIWVLALVGYWRRRRHGHRDRDRGYVLLALSPFPLLLGNVYGGEILLRTYLFSLPFMAFFAAACLHPREEGRSESVWTPMIRVLLSAVFVSGLLVVYYGKERGNYISKKEVAAANYIYSIAPRGSLLLRVTVNYPGAFRHYEDYTYVSILQSERPSRSAPLTDPVGKILRVMHDPEYPGAFLLITSSEKAASDMSGLLPRGAIDGIERSLLRSQGVVTVYHNSDATVFAPDRAVNVAAS